MRPDGLEAALDRDMAEHTRSWLPEQLVLQRDIVPEDGRDVSEAREKDFLSHMLSEQMPRLFAYVKKGSTVVRYVHSFRKLYEPGQPEHGSVFGSTGDRDDEGNDPWWVKLATGCFKFKKVKGRFSTDEFHAFYDNTENKGKIWKPEETPQAPQEEKQLPPMVYLPGEFGGGADDRQAQQARR